MPIDDFLLEGKSGGPDLDSFDLSLWASSVRQRLVGVSISKLDLKTDDLFPLEKLMRSNFAQLSLAELERLEEIAVSYERAYGLHP